MSKSTITATDRAAMTIRRALATLCVLAGGLWPAAAYACSCAGGALPCDVAWGADAVFVGHVISIETTLVAGTPFAGGGKRVELAVVEAFRGLQLSQVTLDTGNTSCDVSFAMGQSYLVYAHRLPNGQLSTSVCARTRPVGQASEDLRYLRSLATMNPRRPARVDGVVQLFEWPAPAGGWKPWPRLVVTANGNGRTATTRTNERGEFRLNGLSVGTYELRARAPDGYRAVERTIEVHDPRGCGTVPLYVEHDARVSGRVVDARDGAIGRLPLALLPADSFSLRPNAVTVQAWTKPDGTFELERVQPGNYLLGFGSIRSVDGRPTMVGALHPGVQSQSAATQIAVVARARVRLGDFVVPESITLAPVAGIVVDEAGSPVRGARVVLRQDVEGGNRVGPPAVTGEDGRFGFSLIDGASYLVHVTRYLGDERRPTGTQISMVPFTVAPSTPLVTVVMKADGN